MRLLKQSTAYDLMLFMTSNTDHLSGATGLTLTITASKAGAAFASISPTVTERGNGWYALALTSSHTDTLGELALHVTGSGADPTDAVMQVRANVLGDTLPANVTQLLGSAVATPTVAGVFEVDVTHWIGTAAATPTMAGVPEVDVTYWLGGAVATPSVTGVPKVDLAYSLGVAVTNYDGTAQAGGSSTITLESGSSSVTDFYKGRVITIVGSTTGAGQSRFITAYNGTTKVATVHAAWATNPSSDSTYIFEPTADANVTHWLGTAASTPTVAGVPNVNVKTWNDLTTVALPLVPTTAGRTLDVSTGGEAGIDWANVGTPGATVSLSATTVATVTTTATATNVTTVNGLAANVITAAAIAADAIGASELAADAVAEIQSGLSTLTAAGVRSAIGMATANLDTQIGTLATASALATVDDFLDTEIADIRNRLPAALVDGKMLSTMAMEDFFLDDSGQAFTDAAPNSVVYELMAGVADAVWDLAVSGHTTSGTFGAAMQAAGSAGDPWSTVLPGAYGSGTAGYAVGTNLNATVGSRASQTSLDTVDDFLDTEIADIRSRLPAALVGGRIDANVGAISADATAADNLETMLDGTGGQALTLSHVVISRASGGPALSVTAADNAYPAVYFSHENTGPGLLVQSDGISAVELNGATYGVSAPAAATTALLANLSGDVTGKLLGGGSGTITGTGARADVRAWNGTAPNNLSSGRVDVTVGAMQTDTLTAAALATDAVTEIQSGLSTLTAAGVRTAVGLASANLDTQLSTIDDFLDTEIAAIYARIGAPAGASIAADIAAVKTETAAILDDTGTSGVVVASASKTGYTLSSAGLDSVVIESGSPTINARQSLSLIVAACAGVTSGMETSTAVIKGVGTSTTRITATTTADGNRTAVTPTPPA